MAFRLNFRRQGSGGSDLCQQVESGVGDAIRPAPGKGQAYTLRNLDGEGGYFLAPFEQRTESA